ncbi:TetR/AcrR family transcriptional regulator [Bacillus sp. 03113]|uniref:TetR/AcrR family transcriptional regulator n=1 Tax=Bacillus sp. 03113 TaxID=2578211 RepID=UPI0011433369|nr:TetR/AcrR family transcriptional regulator [Bacillus sp. 03113]
MNRSEQIMNITHQLLLERGYSAFSYADIANEIGIQKASIHYHFPSKANLIQNVVSRYRSQVENNLALLDSMTDDPYEKLKQYLSYWDECLQRKATDICLCALLSSEIQILPEEVQKEIQAHYQQLTSWFAKVLKDAEAIKPFHLPYQSIDEFAICLLASVHGGMLASRTFNDGMYFHKIKDQLLYQMNVAS